MRAVEFGKYVQSKFYPHIAQEHIFGTKITFLKTFYRSDLALRSWNSLISTVNSVIATGKMELTKDSTVIIVRDWSKKLREELTEEEMAKYANTAFKSHIDRKKAQVNADMTAGKKN